MRALGIGDAGTFSWDVLGPVMMFGSMLIVCCGVGYYVFSLARKRVAQWASENDFHLVRCEWRMSSDSRFGIVSRSQLVYAVRVRAANGVVRDGWLRIGLIAPRPVVHWCEDGESAFR